MERMKVIKKITNVVLALGVMFCAVGCDDGEEWQKQLDQLQATVEQQAEKIQELENETKQQSDKMLDMEEKVSEQTEKIAELEKEKEGLEAEIEELGWADKINNGSIFMLEEAYEKGVISRKDLMHIAYYQYGKVEEQRRGNIVEIEFTPEMEQPVLDEKIQLYLKQAVYQKDKESFASNGYPNMKSGLRAITFIKYLGEYNGNYVVKIDVSFIEGGDAAGYDLIDSIRFPYSSGGVNIVVFCF